MQMLLGQKGGGREGGREGGRRRSLFSLGILRCIHGFILYVFFLLCVVCCCIVFYLFVFCYFRSHKGDMGPKKQETKRKARKGKNKQKKRKRRMHSPILRSRSKHTHTHTHTHTYTSHTRLCKREQQQAGGRAGDNAASCALIAKGVHTSCGLSTTTKERKKRKERERESARKEGRKWNGTTVNFVLAGPVCVVGG